MFGTNFTTERLLRDLRELRENPLFGANLIPTTDNLVDDPWHGNLVVGKDTVVHFVCYFPKS